jgi:two-component system, OmpR family, KDP operon response regulator KdpE
VTAPVSGSDVSILVVEDEPPIRRLLRNTLGVQSYRVLEAANGRDGLAQLRDAHPDIVILDLGLPDMDGLEFIREVRKGSAVPIVVLSSRDDEKGKVEALDSGADDYVTKPFGAEELVARIRAALRHRLQEEGVRPVFRSGDLSVDLVHRQVAVRGAALHLSPKEYEILAQLVRHAGKVLTHRHLMKEVWGGETDAQYLRVYIRQLRQKIEPDPERPTHILTESGVGYRLVVQG